MDGPTSSYKDDGERRRLGARLVARVDFSPFASVALALKKRGISHVVQPVSFHANLQAHDVWLHVCGSDAKLGVWLRAAFLVLSPLLQVVNLSAQL